MTNNIYIYKKILNIPLILDRFEGNASSVIHGSWDFFRFNITAPSANVCTAGSANWAVCGSVDCDVAEI